MRLHGFSTAGLGNRYVLAAFVRSVAVQVTCSFGADVGAGRGENRYNTDRGERGDRETTKEGEREMYEEQTNDGEIAASPQATNRRTRRGKTRQSQGIA